ncbi:MAG: hypothetical protein NTX64_18175 [Elusimicrobia bacterium]|nr:hypothetical protein [Elusimicrobiota bacterium]
MNEKNLVEQARAASEVFRSVERHFQDPRGDAGREALRWAASAAAAGQDLERELEQAPLIPGASNGRRKQVVLISRALGRLCLAGRALVEEAVRFGVPEDPALQELAHEARRSAEELASAAERRAGGFARIRGGPAPVAAAAAARAAGRTEHLRRNASRSLGEEPNAVAAIKLSGLHRRFSEAAAHAAEAADLLFEDPIQ